MVGKRTTRSIFMEFDLTWCKVFSASCGITSVWKKKTLDSIFCIDDCILRFFACFSFDILLAKASRWQQAAAELHKYFLDDESIHRRGLDLKNVYLSTKKFTPVLQIFYTFLVFGLNVHVLGVKVPPKCNEKDNFHKALPNVKKAYVTLRKFTPDLKIFYTDISAISVTLCNSVYWKEKKNMDNKFWRIFKDTWIQYSDA